MLLQRVRSASSLREGCFSRLNDVSGIMRFVAFLYYKSICERKGKSQNCGKSYSTPADKGIQRVLDEKKLSEGETPTYVRCLCMVSMYIVLLSVRAQL